MFAAARRPEATKSLTLLEPAAFTFGHGPDADALVEEIRGMWDSALSDDEWVVQFLKAVGSDPDSFPPEFLTAAVPLVPVFRRGRPVWSEVPPLVELAAARIPTLVVDGGHHAGLSAICDHIAAQIGASQATIEGAGHEIQFTGQPINDAMLALWRSGSSAATNTSAA